MELFPELYVLRLYSEMLIDRLRMAREDDRGMTTETVVITALLAAAAIAAGLIITKKVTDKANNIPTQ